MKKKLLRACSALCGAFVVLGIILNCVNYFGFSKSFYKKEYEKLGTAAEIGMSREDLQRATDTLLDYLKDKRDDLFVQANIGGQEREVFNERETLHMVDVKNLYLWAMRIGNGLLILAVLFYLWAFFSGQDKHAVLGGYLQGNFILLGIIAVLGIYAAIDFNSFWTGFHHIFFTNDLWLLDPRTDILIQMVPEQFFFDLVMRIVVVSAGLIAALMGIAQMAKRRKKAEKAA